MGAKNVSSVVDDINNLFLQGHEVSPERAAELGKDIADVIVKRLAEANKPEREFALYMSNLGKPDRQLWYEAHGFKKPPLPAPARIKFLFGDILEHMVLFLAEEAGHEVTHKQQAVSLNGVRGRMDGRIDGVLVDVKSASTPSFGKFRSGSLRMDDPFGYFWQLSGYAEADGSEEAGFLVIDKTLGNLCYMPVPGPELELYDVTGRIEHMKAVIANPEPPRCCAEEVPDGKSGNMKLDSRGSYCDFHCECYPELRTFIYSTGPRYLTKVAKTPEVFEVTKNKKEELPDGERQYRGPSSDGSEQGSAEQSTADGFDIGGYSTAAQDV